VARLRAGNFVTAFGLERHQKSSVVCICERRYAVHMEAALRVLCVELHYIEAQETVVCFVATCDGVLRNSIDEGTGNGAR
jgi:phosphate-selective porin